MQALRNVTDNRGFHQHEKEAKMDDEVSLSHILRKRNSFVKDGQSYGEALGRFILGRGLVPWKAPRIVEVGGGLGDLAADLIPVLKEAGKEPHYTVLDLSPKLQGAQRRRLAEAGLAADYILGDAEKLERSVGGFDLLISNEAIGDFRVIHSIPLVRDGVHTGSGLGGGRKPWGLAWDMIDKYGLEVPKVGDVFSFAVNWGAIRFAESLWRTLSPGGSAFIVENSSPYAEPINVTGHTEYSISELHLGRVFRKLGFDTTIGNVNEFLWVSPEARMVDEQHVNLWLKMGFDPADERRGAEVDALLMGIGGVRLKPIKSRDRRAPIFDEAMTVQEYSEHARKMGWALDSPKRTPVPTDNVSYFMLRKPAESDIEPKKLKRT